MSTIAALNWRYSLKQFSDKRVDDQKVTSIIEAARLSASSYGLQPYQVWAISDETLLKALGRHVYDQKQVTSCSHLLVLINDTSVTNTSVDQYFSRYLSHNRTPRPQIQGYIDHVKSAMAAKDLTEQQHWAQQQAYIGLGAMLTEAAVLGVDTCPMTGFEQNAFNQILALDNQTQSVCAICALGYRDPLALPPQKIRKPYSEFTRHL